MSRTRGATITVISGCIFAVLMGFVAQGTPTDEGRLHDTIVCRRLVIVSDNGIPVIDIKPNFDGGGIVFITDSKGNPGHALSSTDEVSGHIIFPPSDNGETKTGFYSLAVSDYGPSIVLRNKDGKETYVVVE